MSSGSHSHHSQQEKGRPQLSRTNMQKHDGRMGDWRAGGWVGGLPTPPAASAALDHRPGWLRTERDRARRWLD